MAKLIEEEDSKKHGRSIFQLREEEKAGYQKIRLERKKKKQEETKRIIEEKKNLLDKRIEKTATLLNKLQDPKKVELLTQTRSGLESLRVSDNQSQIFGYFFLIYFLNY